MGERNIFADIFWLMNGMGDVQIEKYSPKKILKSGPCTIVFWQDGTKTMVRRATDEVDDDYSAFTAALAIKIFGSNSAVKRIVKDKLVEQIKKTKNPKNNS